MIDYSTVQSLIIPDGEVILIEDGKGNVLWQFGQPIEPVKAIVLEVEKITSNTYAGETLYENEQFILLDIYPKNANSVVKVTYGGLTKILTFRGTNAQQVYFGTFNGVSDSVETSVSGTLMIEGGCQNFAVGTYKEYSSVANKTNTKYCGCITAVSEWSEITSISQNAFRWCSKLTSIMLPSGITTIGSSAFSDCEKLKSLTIPAKVGSIGGYIIDGCDALTELILLPTTPPTLPDNSGLALGFTASIIVPKGCGEAYKAASIWSEYADYIVEAS